MSEDTWSLVEALRTRGELTAAGRAALADAYPDTPPAMLDTATFHLFTDGATAAVEWLAGLERFIRNPAAGLDYTTTWHLLYHVYNWQQFAALLPASRAGLAEGLADAEKLLAEGDPGAAGQVLRELRAVVEGQLWPPNLERAAGPRAAADDRHSSGIS